MATSSVANVKTTTPEQEAIKKQMDANSQAWHTADEATRKQLEAANRELAAQMGGLSYDPASGTWSNTDSGSNSGGQSSNGGTGSGYVPMNKNNYTGDNFDDEVKKQNDYIAENPSAVTYLPTDQRQKDTSSAGTNGYYTEDENELAAAMGAGYKAQLAYRKPDGTAVYYISDLTRTTQEGASGADESRLSDEDYAYVQFLKADYEESSKLYEQAVQEGKAEDAAKYKAKMEQDHLEAERVRAGYGYSGGSDGSMYIDYLLEATRGKMPAYRTGTKNALDAKGISYTLPPWEQQEQPASGSFGGSTGGTGGTQGGGSGLPDASGLPSSGADDLVKQWEANIPDVDKAKADQLALLEEWKKTLLEQSNGQIDYNVAKAITELERALADAQPQFKEQQESVAKDEMQSLDNSALYAETRGDKGGIGQEQYNSIMNTAAQNRLSVQQAQTKLATDTQRQIADLRAQGEFEKANALLEISQQYLSQLINLEQWALDYGMNVAQFKASLDQWAANYKLAIAEFEVSVDQWNQNFAYQQYRDQVADEQWWAQFEHGVEQDGIANNQWDLQFKHATEQDQIANDQWWAQFNKPSSKGTVGNVGDIYDQMSAAGITSDRAYAYLIAQGYSDTEASKMERTYGNLLKTMNNTPTSEAYDSVMTAANNLWDSTGNGETVYNYLMSKVKTEKNPIGDISEEEAELIAEQIAKQIAGLSQGG